MLIVCSKQVQKDPACHGLDLESLLILPVQRIPRYIMLLKDLYRHTPPAHPDYEHLGRNVCLLFLDNIAFKLFCVRFVCAGVSFFF